MAKLREEDIMHFAAAVESRTNLKTLAGNDPLADTKKYLKIELEMNVNFVCILKEF